jgi:hypothetical protein
MRRVSIVHDGVKSLHLCVYPAGSRNVASDALRSSAKSATLTGSGAMAKLLFPSSSPSKELFDRPISGSTIAVTLGVRSRPLRGVSTSSANGTLSILPLLKLARLSTTGDPVGELALELALELASEPARDCIEVAVPERVRFLLILGELLTPAPTWPA